MALNDKTVNVYKAQSINITDKLDYKGEPKEVNLDDENSFQKAIILLYMYILPDFPEHGTKVGMTKCHIGESYWHAIKKRILEQKHELALNDDEYEDYGYKREVVYWDVCLNTNDDNFKNHDVHRLIKEKCAGITEKEQEWFTNTPRRKLIDTFLEVRNVTKTRDIYTPRKEQQSCIDALHTYFNKNPVGKRFLLNCKMRFGKCYTTYKYAEEADINKILILTFVPAVQDSWRDDLLHIKKEYDYFTDDNLRRTDFSLKDKDKPYVVFLSLQNLLGKDGNSRVKEKIQKLQGIDFDLVVLDEYHFGAWNQKTQETFEEFDDKYVKKVAALKEKGLLNYLSLSTKKTICLSGTPFKALARGEFSDENSFTYSYFDEQQNKYPTEDKDIINPDYAEFPDMKILGYNMSHLFSNLSQELQSKEKILNKSYFSLNQFFATEYEKNHTKGDNFIYEGEIKLFLEILKGKTDQGKDFPYSNLKLLNSVRHTLWLMPSVSSCCAMYNILVNDDYFNKYEIINLSDPDVGSGEQALRYLNNGIKKAENTNKLGTIALTVNKLTIGVTVKKWFGIFILKDLASPEQYFQAIFRIQTPYVNRKKHEILKKECFVYDFNIDRASALLLQYAKQYESENGKNVRLQIAKLIVKYLPIYINGDLSNPISEDVFYQLAQMGDTSNQSLSSKIRQLGTTTRFNDQDLISMMLHDKDCDEVIKKIFAHAKFTKNSKATPPKTQDEMFISKVYNEGHEAGYRHGVDDYTSYVNYDDTEIQAAFDKKINDYLKFENNFPKNTQEFSNFENGFKDGYEKGLNVPIKKQKIGSADGEAYAIELKSELGDDVLYTAERSKDIKNFINSHLNESDVIPKEYQGALSKRWYCDSFKSACIEKLRPPKPKKENENTIEDAGNVLQHILSRLFEFLYISIYRETTFQEIFDNADENLFKAAVGITKSEFEVLNKYKVFQVDILNNYIHEFFVNEALGDKLDLTNEEIKKKYRNSFDWFGFGLEKAENKR